jgi:hypothetical protein
MWWKKALVVALFVAFVPGVLVTLPSKTSGKWTVLAVHAVLFVVATHLAMKALGYEHMGNFGNSCPPSHYMDESENCRAKPVNGAPGPKYE